jgi:carbohydrate diacid regulator
MLLSGDIAQRIVDRVANGLEKQVSVADVSGRVLASSDPAFVGMRHGVAAQALTADELIEVAEAQLVSIGLPLKYADAVVGAIVFSDTQRQSREIVRVAKTLAELIIHQMTVIEQLPQQKWARAKFIHDLLWGRFEGPAESMLQEAAVFRIDLAAPRLVVALDFGAAVECAMSQADDHDALPTIARALRLDQVHADLTQQVRRALCARERDDYSFIDERTLVALPVIDGRTPDRDRRSLADALQPFLDALRRDAGLPASAGIGRYSAGWQALAHSFADARFALETGARVYGPGQAFLAEDLGVASFVCSNDTEVKSSLARRVLQPLDGEPELLATLEVFLRSNLSPSQTAQALHIHRHTLAYRLDKIAHLTGSDPREFEAAAQFHAALVLRLAGCE